MAVQSIFIITEEGEAVQSVTLGDFKADDALFGGFMSAIQSFSRKISGNALEQLATGDLTIFVNREDGYLLVTIHDKDDPNALTRHKIIQSEFKKHFKGEVNKQLMARLKQAAQVPLSGAERASEWARKML